MAMATLFLLLLNLIDGKYRPDLDDSGRVINGAVFDKIYKPFQMAADNSHVEK